MKTTKKQLLSGVKAAIKAAGGQVPLAEALGYKSSCSISEWLTRYGYVPIKHVPTIHKLYGVSKHKLRPDFYDKDD